MPIGSQGFRNYSRNLGRMYRDSLEEAKVRELRRKELKRTLDALPWSIGEPPVARDERDGTDQQSAKVA